MDAARSAWRWLYTLLLIIPLAMFRLVWGIRILARTSPWLLDPPLGFMVVWAILTVTSALGLIIWRHDQIGRTHWVDLLPTGILALIALTYTLYGLSLGVPSLALLIAVTASPLWAAFGLSLPLINN
ncbi:MAG: hypothetical protein ACE5GO_12540 [Anaerolineales bacterium]